MKEWIRKTNLNKVGRIKDEAMQGKNEGNKRLKVKKRSNRKGRKELI